MHGDLSRLPQGVNKSYKPWKLTINSVTIRLHANGDVTFEDSQALTLPPVRFERMGKARGVFGMLRRVLNTLDHPAIKSEEDRDNS